MQFISFTRVIIIELLINHPHTPGFERKTHTAHAWTIHSPPKPPPSPERILGFLMT
jgi:hypothetical protein